MTPEILAIIPARKGSKGLSGKNMKLLAGKPLISWTCESVLQSRNQLSRIVVSTDWPELGEYAKELGIEFPFIRPEQFATDQASAVDVVFHCLDWLKTQENWCPTAVLLLQPTSPLRSASDIHQSVTLFLEKRASAIVSVCPASHPAEWLKRINEEGVLVPWQNESFISSRRQESPVAYEPNGAIYLIRTEILMSEKTFWPSLTLPYIMPRERSVDIDTPWDFYLAELILRDQKK